MILTVDEGVCLYIYKTRTQKVSVKTFSHLKALTFQLEVAYANAAFQMSFFISLSTGSQFIIADDKEHSGALKCMSGYFSKQKISLVCHCTGTMIL